jgi:hypothetical protein
MNWTKSAWDHFHIVAKYYPLKPSNVDFETYYMFYKTFGKTLPCIECRKHYEIIFNKYKIHNYLKNKNLLFKWTYLMHKDVSNKLKKKTVSFISFKNKYNINK